ncbi:MAG TPA: PAS domain S-box protein [Solirubrobacterales bacterium]|nr:PAS domain S-box protein [Solirubrobacterales bacterium]
MTLAFAGALFVGIFALGIVVDDPAEAPSVLYVLPVALIAIRFGALGGAIAATFALILFGVVNTVNEEGTGALGYLTRATAFYVLALLLGNFSTRLRTTYEIVLNREQQLQAILDNSTAVIYVKDREGKYILVNRKFEALFRVERGKAIGKTDRDLFPGYMADAFRANDRRVLKEDASLETEEIAPGEGGEHTFISVKFPLHDATGQAYGVCGISTDITARKVAETALKESKENIGQIIDGAREAFVSMNQRGEVIAWNRAAEEMFGWPAAKAVGKQLAELIIPARYREAHQRGLDRFLRTGKGPMLNSRVELLALHRDGSEFPVEVSITAVRVRGGFSFHAFIHDIADRKRLEREVVRLSELRAGALNQ